MASIYGSPRKVINSGLQLDIDPSIVAPNGTTVYDAKNPSSLVTVGTINNSGGVYSNQYSGIFSFNGSNQWVDLSSGLTFNAGSTFQIMLRRSNAGGYSTFSCLFSTRTNPVFNCFDSLGTQNYSIETQAKGSTAVSPTFNNDIPDWYLLTVVSENKSSGDVSLYKNDLSQAYTVTGASAASGTYTNLRFGADVSNYLGDYFKGDIGAFLFYNRALTLSEIAYNYSIIAKRFNV